MGLLNRSGHTRVDSQPITPPSSDKHSAASKAGKHKGRKVSTFSNPFKKIINAITSFHAKKNKSLSTRSVSLPSDLNLAGRKATVRRSESLQNLEKPSMHADQKTHPNAFKVPDPVKGSDGRIDLDATARNVIQQVDVLDQACTADAELQLDPKSAKVMFTEVVKQALIADTMARENLVEYVGLLDVDISSLVSADNKGKAQSPELALRSKINKVRDQLHKEMKDKVDKSVDMLLESSPNLRERLAREDKEAISRDLQSAAFRQMAELVWQDTRVSESAEEVAPELQWIAKFAQSPEKKPETPKAFKPPTSRKPGSKDLKSRAVSSAAVEKTVVTKQNSIGNAKAQEIPSRERSVTIAPSEKESTASISSPREQPAPAEQSAITSASAATIPPQSEPVEESPTESVISPSEEHSSEGIDPESLTEMAKGLRNSLAYLSSVVDTQLSAEAAGVAKDICGAALRVGVNDGEAMQVALLFRDAITDHGFTIDQGKSLGVEVINWLNDEAGFNTEEVFKAGEMFSQWLANGYSEEEAHNSLTQWLYDGVYAQGGEGDDEFENATENVSDRAALLGDIEKGLTLKPVPKDQQPSEGKGLGRVLPDRNPSVESGFRSAARTGAEAADSSDAAVVQEQSSAAAPEPVGAGSEDGISDLLKAIRKGKNLRKVGAQEKKYSEGLSAKSTKLDGLADVLNRQLEAKSDQVNGSQTTGADALGEDLSKALGDFFYENDDAEFDENALQSLKTKLMNTLEQASGTVGLLPLAADNLKELINDALQKYQDGDDISETVSNWITNQTSPKSK